MGRGARANSDPLRRVHLIKKKNSPPSSDDSSCPNRYYKQKLRLILSYRASTSSHYPSSYAPHKIIPQKIEEKKSPTSWTRRLRPGRESAWAETPTAERCGRAQTGPASGWPCLPETPQVSH